MSNQKTLLAATPLFLVLIIDSMGLGLLFPILNSLIIDPSYHFLPNSMNSGAREFLFSTIIAIFMFCWFFGAAILGDLSDMIGRKKALIICLLGAFLGYFLSAIAVLLKSISLLIIGRVIAGFTAGSQAIAQAAIVDVSTKEYKTRNISYMILAISIGFVLGPIVGGFLSDKNLEPWFNFTTPLYFISLLALLNIFFLLLFFKETFRIKGKVNIRLLQAVHMFFDAFKHVKIKKLSFSFLIMIYAWGSYFSFISVFAFKQFHYSPVNVSLLLTDISVGFAIGCAYLVDFLAKRYPLKQSVMASMILASASAFLTLVHSSLTLWLFALMMGIAVSIAYSMAITLFSNQVSEKEQGWIMGITGSIMALSYGMTTFITGFIVRIDVNLSMIICGVGMLLSALVMSFFKDNQEV